MTLPMIALAKIWKRSVPTARMPLIPADMRAGAMMNPPPAPMQPVIRPGAETDKDRRDEDARRIERGAVGLFAAQHIGQDVAGRGGLFGDLRRGHRTEDEDRQQQQEENQNPLGIAEDSSRDIELPGGVGLSCRWS